MTSVQDTLKLKRVPLDKWSTSEQLYLASAVACSGDQNWMSVSRSLKMFCGGNRPSDWFSQKSCAAQYGKLLENVETPKRKKRSEKDTCQTTVETPSELILRKLRHERIAELKKLIQDERQEYNKTKEEITAIQNGAVDEPQLKEMWKQIELEEKQREKEQQSHAQWLKEREERKKELERAWRPNSFLFQQSSPNQSPSKTSHLGLKVKLEEMEVDDLNSRQGTSPLLTSLLKSPSPAPNPGSSILNTMNLGSNQTRAAAPTITNLLTGSITNISTSLATTTQKLPAPTLTTTPPSFPNPLHTQPLTGPPTSEQALNNIIQSPSQSAPTLSMLLENKNRDGSQKLPPLTRIDAQPIKSEISDLDAKGSSFGGEILEGDLSAVDSPIKDEDQQLMEVFNGLIPDNIDELADILTENNAIILNSELLEEDEMLNNVEDLIDAEEAAADDADKKSFVEQLSSSDLSTSNHFQNVLNKSDNSQEKADQQEVDAQKDGVDESTLDIVKEKAEVVEPKQETTPLMSLDGEVKTPFIKDDESSDLSNDTPLSELLKQDGNIKMEQMKNSPVTREEPDTFESDSNDDKCLESIKREIQGLSELKGNNSSENSSEVPDEKSSEKPEINIDENTLNSNNIETVLESPEEKNETIEEPAETLPEEDSEKFEEVTEEIEKDEQTIPEGNETNTEENVEVKLEEKGSIESVEIVEIKDDKSDDDKPESIILIEETDDANSEETPTEVPHEPEVKVEEPSEPSVVVNESCSQPPDRKSSSDDEIFEDAKDHIDDIKLEVEEQPTDTDPPQQTIMIIDTDDDSPMEVIKEDKTGRTKRDYSRRKQESTPSTDKRSDGVGSGEDISNTSTRMKLKDRDRSESPYVDEESGEPAAKSKRRYSSTPNIDSLPNSPASSDDREYRGWKKSILIVYNRLSTHKNASLFAKPISEDHAPNYKNIVLQPMDLQTLKRNIDSGHIRTTIEFQRYVMIMCYNAIFYNFNDEITCTRAKEMLSDGLTLIDEIMHTWRKESEKSASSSSSSATKAVRGRKSNRLMA